MTRQAAVVVGIYLVTSLGVTGVSRVLDERLKTEIGLVQSVELIADDERISLFTRTTSDIDLSFLDDDPEIPRRFFEARWEAVWYVPDDMQVDVHAGADDAVTVWVDDDLVLERDPEIGMFTTSESIALDAGLHRLDVRYVQRGGGYYMNVQWAPAGDRARPFDPEQLFPTRPDPEQIARNRQLLFFRRFVAAFWIAPPLVYLFWFGLPAAVRFGRDRVPAMSRRVWLWCGAVGNHVTRFVRETRARQRTRVVLGGVGVVLFGVVLYMGRTADTLAHTLSIAHGVGASLACAACLYLGGSALIPRKWDATFRVGESPAMLGAALYVLLCWFGIQFGIPIRTVAIGWAIAVLAVISARHRWFLLVARSSRAGFRHTAGWVVGFCLLYVFAYLFTMPPVTDEYLPLAWSGNIDLLNYLRYTRHLLDLGPSNHVGFGYLDGVYLQTPGAFYLFGGFSLPFGADPMNAAMPMRFAFIALIGLFVARVSYAVFGMSVASALAIGGIVISGPFLRYLAGAYFLSTLMSIPILLYLMWMTVAYRPQRWLDAALAVRFGSAYVLLLFIYPFLFFVGLAIQLGAVSLRFAADLQLGTAAWSSWRDAGRHAGRTLCASLAPLGVLALGLYDRLEWSLNMVLSLSQPGVAGWPMDIISPLSVLALPGVLKDGGQVVSAEGRVWAIGTFCTLAAILGLLFLGRFRQRTTAAQRAFAGLAGMSFIAYCAYYLVVGPSYQQWKFASYSVLPLSFVAPATAICLFRKSEVFTHVTRTTLGRRWMTAVLVTLGVCLLGGNLLVHAVGDAELMRFPGSLRNIAMLEELQSFQEMSVEMELEPSDIQTWLALHFLPSKRVHVVARMFSPNEPLSLEHISSLRPHLIQNFGCQGVGHDETITVPGVGCLLLAPPSLSLDTVYPFHSTFLFVDPRHMGAREPDGRWNTDTTVSLNVMADPQRVSVGRDLYLNLRLSPYVEPETPSQRALFSWGAGQKAEVSLKRPEWISLATRVVDWTGNWLKTMPMTVDLPDGVDGDWLNLPVQRDDWSGSWTAPVAVEIPSGVIGHTEHRSLAVMFQELSVTASPLGRVVTPTADAAP